MALVEAPGNTVGGTTPAQRNIISGNDFSGVYVFGDQAAGNLVQGNFIGLAADGTNPLPNHGHAGIEVAGGSLNLIGGTDDGAGNVIAGNDGDGISVTTASGGSVIVAAVVVPFATVNPGPVIVQGNWIGTVADGSHVLPNAGNGIRLDAIAGNTIGGTARAAANTIAGNAHNGLLLTGAGATDNLIQGNFVGTNAALAVGLGNGENGVLVTGSASNNTIGGTDAGAGNVLIGNQRNGVSIASGTGNAILGNSIAPINGWESTWATTASPPTTPAAVTTTAAATSSRTSPCSPASTC